MPSLIPFASGVFIRCVAGIFLLLLGSPVASAHGDDQALIDALTEELAKAPEADLFIRRGEIFRHHEEWGKAEADFSAAGKLEPMLAVVDFFRARVLFEARAPDKALVAIERYLARESNPAEGWFLRGEIRAALGQPAAAADDYGAGIERTASPRPEHFLRRAKLVATSPEVDVARVLALLDEGITRLGPVVTLVDYAIALELERRDYAAALRRIVVALEKAPRPEAWLVRQGDVLVQLGRTQDAIASYRAALNAIEELPPRYRAMVPIEKLARDARNTLQRLASH